MGATRDGNAGNATRRDGVASARRVVVKVGSHALVDDAGHLDERRLDTLVGQIAVLRQAGREVVCVSSGAIAAGLPELGLSRPPADLPSLQAAAAIGQAALMEIYRRHFRDRGFGVGQVLLTHADLRERERHLNARNTLSRLLRSGVVPIINENDTVSVDEIRFGDNDLLSALVSVLVRADVLVLLTSVDGLLTRPPEEHGELVREVPEITETIRAMAGGAGSAIGTGGMRSKLEAADIVTRSGEHAIIANARTDDVLVRLLEGEPLGTHFLPHPSRLPGRKRWIAFFDHPQGTLHLDAGAAKAVRGDGRSLLPVGIHQVDGRFGPGAPVRLVDRDGRELARGLVNYGDETLRRILGRRASEIAGILGRCDYEEVVHRDNLVVRDTGA